MGMRQGEARRGIRSVSSVSCVQYGTLRAHLHTRSLSLSPRHIPSYIHLNSSSRFVGDVRVSFTPFFSDQ